MPGVVGVAAGQVSQGAAGLEEPDVGAVADGQVPQGLRDVAFPDPDPTRRRPSRPVPSPTRPPAVSSQDRLRSAGDDYLGVVDEPVDHRVGYLYSLWRQGRPAWGCPSWTSVNDVLRLLAEELLFVVGAEQEGEALEIAS